MKKVLSLVLAVVLVLGMTTVVFAADGDFDGQVTETYPTTGRTTVYQGETKEVTLASALDAAAGANGTVPVISDGGLNDVVASYANASTVVKLKFTVPTSMSTGDKDLTVVIGNDAGSDDLTITLKLEVVSATKAIPSGYKITGIVDGAELNPTKYSSTGLKMDKMTSGDKIEFGFTADMFTWEDSKGVAQTAAGTDWAKTAPKESHLSKVKVRLSDKKNTGNFKKLAMDGAKFVMQVEDFFTGVKDVEGNFTIQLQYNGKTGGDATSWDFVVTNEEEIVDEGQETAMGGTGKYLKADATVRGLEIETDGTLFFTTNMSSGAKLFVAVTTDLSSADEELILKFAELDSIYTVHQNGLRAASTTAEFVDMDATYHVYDADFNYIGTTDDKKLPYSGKYYLTTKKIDLGGTEVTEPVEPEPTPDPTTPTPDPEVPGTGGDDGAEAPSNPTFNPNTGL